MRSIRTLSVLALCFMITACASNKRISSKDYYAQYITQANALAFIAEKAGTNAKSFSLADTYSGRVDITMNNMGTTSSYGDCRGSNREYYTWKWHIEEQVGNQVTYWVEEVFCNERRTYNLKGRYNGRHLYLIGWIDYPKYDSISAIRKYEIKGKGKELRWVQDIITKKSGFTYEKNNVSEYNPFPDYSLKWQHLTAN